VRVRSGVRSSAPDATVIGASSLFIVAGAPIFVRTNAPIVRRAIVQL
jgi:hypothetical protein